MSLPQIGERLPQQGNWLTRAIGRALLRLTGWGFEGELPNREKFLVIAAPHTTSWDFIYAMIALLGLGIRVSWLGVDWLFRIPFMRAIGGIPVDRSAGSGIVPQAVAEFERRERFVLGMSPEGSRKKVVPWKTGFYRIARGADVPVLLAAIDQRARVFRFGPLIELSDNYEADLEEKIFPFFERYRAEYPDNFGF